MTTKSIKPSVFIGSSSEGLEFARAARASLQEDAEVTLWNEGVFKLGQTFVEGLTNAVSRFDFAVLVLTPDDLVESRLAESFGPRDNVIFELGLFMGRLGRDRTFIIHQAHPRPKIPTDLSGVTTAQYEWPRTDKNYRAAVSGACDQIREAICARGTFDQTRQGDALGLDLKRVKEVDGAMSTTVCGCEIRVIDGRVEEFPHRSDTVVVLPCNEYFDDRCALDVNSSLGAYVNKTFRGRVDDFMSLVKDECRLRLGRAVDQQKTASEVAPSFGAGRAILIANPLGHSIPVALLSTTIQRAGQGLMARTSYLFDGIAELVARLVDARLHEIVMPILGSGHGRMDAPLAFVSLLLAISEVARYASGGTPLRRVTIIVFKRTPESSPQVDPFIVRRTLALVGSPHS